MQLVGCDPASMAEAAKIQEGNGAAIIDINFGCPVRKVVGQLAGSAPMPVVVQDMSQLAFASPPPSGWCTSIANCELPVWSAPSSGSTATVPSLQANTRYTIRVAALDVDGAIVLGESESYVGLRLRRSANATSAATLRYATVTTAVDVLVAPLQLGVATFDFVIAGTTLRPDSVNTHDLVSLELFCPRVAGSVNPCLALGTGLTSGSRPFTVDSSTAAVDLNADLARYMPVIVVPMRLASLDALDVVAFRSAVLQVLLGGAGLWPPTARSVDLVQLIVCEADDATRVDNLYGRVCGAAAVCSIPFDAACPTGVRVCSCPAPTAAASASQLRRLLQLAAPTTAALTLRGELYFTLRASDLGATTDVAAMYASVATQLVGALRSDARFAAYNIDASGVTVRQNAQSATTPPPTTTAAATSGSPTPVVPGDGPADVSSSFRPAVGVLLAALLTLLLTVGDLL